MSVIFDQLRVSDDGKQLFINAHVNRAKDSSGKSPFDGIFIEKVVVMDANDVTEAISFNSIPASHYLYVKTFTDPTREPYKPTEIDLVLDVNDFLRHGETDVSKIDFCQDEMYKTLFFVFIQCSEEAIDNCLPCSVTGKVSVGVTFDESSFYQKVMNYTRELAEDCESMPQGFVDFILQWNAFKTSVETEHFLPAIKFYNLMFGNGSSDKVYASTKGCGCHGRVRV